MCQQYKIQGQDRKQINASVLTGIQSGISKADALLYSGKGKLHGLDFNQFGSFSQYTDKKKEIENGQFFTPLSVVEQITKVVQPVGSVLDPTCGTGRFFEFLDPSDCTGVELDPEVYQVAQYCYPCATLHRYNTEFWDSKGVKFSYILTNPPFNLKWGSMTSQAFIIRSAKIWLKEYGIFAAVVPYTYLADAMYYKQDRQFITDNFNFIGQVDLGESAFSSEYDIKFRTKVIFFQNCKGAPFTDTLNTWEEISAEMKVAKQAIKSNLIAVAQSEAGENEYSFSDGRRDKNGGYAFQVRKLLFEIKTHGKDLAKAEELISRFSRQQKPSGVDYKEWIKTALTEKRVLSRLRAIAGYKRLKRSKIKSRPASRVETVGFSTLNLPRNEFVEKFRFSNSLGTFALNEIQKGDVTRLLTKKYGILNAEQGTGKTAMAFCVAEYRKTKLNIVLAPALAIATTWQDHLRENEKSFKVIRKRADLDFSVDYWLIGYTALTIGARLPHFIKKQLRSINNNVQLIVDESDELSNRLSKRYKAARTAFSKCRYKLLTTGTTTRNNASELYPQLELLYCNSMNLVDTCTTAYQEETTKDGTTSIRSYENPNKGKPFNGYHGLSQFKAAFSPESTSVLGIKKAGQDLYNYDHLCKVIDQSCIIRTFREVAGDKYTIEHITVQPTLAERTLQESILKEFHEMVYNYYQHTGSSRKESALRIVRQLQLLIKSCSVPQTFKEYTGLGASKLSKIMKIVQGTPDKALIGCVTLQAARMYYRSAKQLNRPAFLITGAVSFQERKRIITEFESTANGVLICTQQSLKSSVNIPGCNTVICESMQWNLPKMAQFYFRCIRFNSIEQTTVYFVTYSDSIEDNLLSLLMAKERINQSIKLEDKELGEVFNEYGFDVDTLDRLMIKERTKDANGNVTTSIRWGKQEKK